MGLVEKVPGDGQWRMIRHLLKQDDEGQSTNRWVDSDEFPTVYFAASWVCHYVVPPALHSFPVPLAVLAIGTPCYLSFPTLAQYISTQPPLVVLSAMPPWDAIFSFCLNDKPWALICFGGQ